MAEPTLWDQAERLVHDWRFDWSQEKDNDYPERARRIDANMRVDLVRRITDLLTEVKSG